MNCRQFYSSKDFRNAYNLMAHEDTISDDMWLLRGLVAVFLLKCLQQTDFFDRSSSNPSTNQEVATEDQRSDVDDPPPSIDAGELTANQVFIGKILFRLINVMPCNTHDISEFETPILDKFAPGCKKVSVGNFEHTKDSFFLWPAHSGSWYDILLQLLLDPLTTVLSH